METCCGKWKHFDHLKAFIFDELTSILQSDDQYRVNRIQDKNNRGGGFFL